MPQIRTTRLANRSRSIWAFALLLAAASAGCVEATTENRVRANAYLRGGDAAAAVQECDLGLAKKGDDAALLILRGKALFELDRLGDARASYQRAIDSSKEEADHTLAEAQLGLAMVATRTGDWAEAKRRFERLIAINEKDATSHLNAARACLQLEQMDCAVAHAEAAGKMRGDEEGTLYTLGTIYLAAGKPSEAELTFQHICEVVPGASSCPYGLALVAAKAGDKAKALAKLDEAITRKIPNPGQIAADPTFASMKDDPAFLALVARATEAK